MENIEQTQVVIIDKIENITDFKIDVFYESIKKDLLLGKLFVEDNNIILKLDSDTYSMYTENLKNQSKTYLSYNKNLYRNLIVESELYFNMKFEKLIFKFKEKPINNKL